MREHILFEIKRLAELGGGKPPGKVLFARKTGIREHQWSGVFWAKWNDALSEAGFEENRLQTRFDTDWVLDRVIEACRFYGHFPTVSEMKLFRRRNASFPGKGVISSHFAGQSGLVAALLKRLASDPSMHDIASMLPSVLSESTSDGEERGGRTTGYVYLLQAGDFYKVGRSADIERRIKQVRVALPQEVTMVHVIETDDPSGIESYWHGRFKSRRVNGEWFKLMQDDISAFRRRKFQ